MIRTEKEYFHGHYTIHYHLIPGQPTKACVIHKDVKSKFKDHIDPKQQNNRAYRNICLDSLRYQKYIFFSSYLGSAKQGQSCLLGGVGGAREGTSVASYSHG